MCLKEGFGICAKNQYYFNFYYFNFPKLFRRS
jgi:hypothetical protein